MYGIANPVISERTWRAAREITAEQFAKDLAFAEDVAFSVNEWRGESRDGKPLAIVWVAGRRSGTLMSAFEITEGAALASSEELESIGHVREAD